MKLKIKLFLSKIISKIILPSDLLHLIENEKIKKCLVQVTIGEKSNFYSDALVENILGDKSKIIIGKGTHIRGELTLYGYANELIIGNNSYIGKWSVIRVGNRIEIGNNVLVSHGVSIIDTDSHEINFHERAEGFFKMVNQGHSRNEGNIKSAPILINDYVWINYGVSILKGVTIGEGAIIGANSVVTKDVEPWTVVAGNPATVVKYLPEYYNNQQE